MTERDSLRLPVTALVLTKNEEAAISDCIRALDFCDQVLVIDSQSEDDTIQIARSLGAEVVPFFWNGKYPKKKQWAMSHPAVKYDWVLHIDADELVSPSLAHEISRSLQSIGNEVGAFDIPIEYHFVGKQLRHGHRVWKRSLVNRRLARFPEVGDLLAPGITEVEGHYQPQVRGRVARLRSSLVHDDPDPLSDWVERHNRYSDWEAFLNTNPRVKKSVRGNRGRAGRIFDVLPFHALTFFIYSFCFRLGFLDGRAGFDYAFGLSWYYWLSNVKTRERARLT